jgi:hypoxanthine phosphoribosyltransferase
MSNVATIKLHDRTFRVMIPAAEIDAAIDRLAARINADYASIGRRAAAVDGCESAVGTREPAVGDCEPAVGDSAAAGDPLGEPPILLGVLNGAFMFMADLARRIDFPVEVSFVKLASYNGTESTDRVNELIGLGCDIEGRHVIVVEDIVDTGNSMEHLLGLLERHRPASIEIAALFFKPAAYRKSFPVKYRAIEVGNEFIIGYGLDYNQLGRNLKDIYVVTDDE